jgi:hypothetical protein
VTLAAVAAVAAVATALAAPAAAAPADDPRTPTRDCRTRIESGHGPWTFVTRGNVVVGPVALTGLSSVAERLPRPDARGRSFAKSALLLRAGHAVTLTVPERLRGRFGLAHARTPEPVPAVRFTTCPPQTRAFSYDGVVGPVTAFNGGFVVSRRGCYPLDVRIDGRRAVRLRIPFGFPCR